MIYDAFVFFNELDLLEIRLNELNRVVDKFVIVEATKTFSNLDKPLYFEENKDRFSEFKNKIIHVVVDDYPNRIENWVIENHQRNAISRGLINCKDEDIILISDCDEIPNPHAIIENINKKGLIILEQKMYYYYFNLQASSDWEIGTRMINYKDFKNGFNNIENYSKTVIKELNEGTTAQKIRHIQDGIRIKNAGWHFSYIGGVEMIIKKIKSCSHYDRVKPADLEPERIKKSIRTGDLRFNLGAFLTAVEIDESFPKYIRNNIEKYESFILRQTKFESFQFFLNKTKRYPLILLKKIFYSIFDKQKLKKIEEKIKKLII